MWTIAHYLPVGLFSLRVSMATTSGGKTLLVPTPYSLKMALLDAAIRTRGLAEGERLWPTLRDLRVAIAVPEQVVVIHGFGKMRKPIRLPGKNEVDQAIARARETGNYPYQATIAYREFVQFTGTLGIALSTADGAPPAAPLGELLMTVNYLGKRGSFVQLAGPVETHEALPDGFVEANVAETEAFPASGTMQMLDDCAPTLTFARANVYTGDRVTLGKERVVRHVVLPLQLRQSSRAYQLYKRLDW
jgi:hypothetical protein